MNGSTISHYRLLEKIGEGGMGVVYKAEDTSLERIVALKFLSASSMRETSRQRFIQEARSAARIQHPNICPIYEIGEDDGRLFFAMAYLEGQNIRQLLDLGPLPVLTALNLAIQIASGLEAAHQHGIVHRDIKSGNVMVDQNKHVSILDFGLALNPEAERMTIPGTTAGTPGYMSPEQAQGIPLDARTDLWSLGVVIFEMLTGQLPFQGESQLSILYAVVNTAPPVVSLLRPQLPEAVIAIVQKALAKDRHQRWHSATEMLSALRSARQTLIRQSETLTSVQNAVDPPSHVWPKPRPWKKVAAALLLVLALVGGRMAFRKLRPDLPEQKQVAVLPFEVIGEKNDPAMRAQVDGLVEALTAKLSQVEDLQGKLVVVPAREIRSRKINSVDDASRVFGVNLVITGSAQRLGNKTQFNEVLEDAATLRQIASRSFDFDTDKVFEFHDRLVQGAVRLLELKLQPQTVRALDAGETAAPTAYQAYLQGVGYLARYDVLGNVDRAIGSLQNAVSADPNYALAYVALGEAHWRKAKDSSDKQEATRALTYIQRALQSDPQLTAARIKLGEIYSESGEPDKAITEEKDALNAAPGSAQAYLVLGASYDTLSRFSEAEDAYEHAVELQPTDWYTHVMLGFFYVQRGRLAEARTSYETAQALTPDNAVVLRNLAVLNTREGKFEEAVQLYSRALKSDPGAKAHAALGLVYYYQKRYQEAASHLETALKTEPRNYPTWGNLGTVYRHLPGQQDKARHCFLKAIELANQSLQVRHGDFRAHANLAEYWAKLGNSSKAMAEINAIPESARGPFIDRIVLVYEFAGDRTQALRVAKSIPENSPVYNFSKNDPDLSALWSALSTSH